MMIKNMPCVFCITYNIHVYCINYNSVARGSGKDDF